jgi:hypothetical protein
MDSHVMFLNCPAYMDKDGGTRCGLPAAVEYRYTMNSTDGPLESAKISCPRRHHVRSHTAIIPRRCRRGIRATTQPLARTGNPALAGMCRRRAENRLSASGRHSRA